MASTTQNIGLKTYDISTDNAADFITGTSQNMVAIDKAISDKVKLNGESLSNVNLKLSPSGDSINSIEVESIGVPKLYKKSKLNSGEWIEISYSEARDLTNYSYKFMY